jgi:hypothetical protein
MNIQEAKTTLEFLKRVTLRPEEINSFVHISNLLSATANPPLPEEGMATNVSPIPKKT